MNSESPKQRHAPQLERGRDWRDDANCVKADPELFFPVGVSEKDAQTEAAKAYCRPCLAKAACLMYALDNNIGHGIWGGLTEKERKAIKQRRLRS